MNDWLESRDRYRRLTSYLIPPVLALYGFYCAFKMEFWFGEQLHVKGPLAILAGLGMVVVAGLLFVALTYRDSWIRGGRPED